jgi:outer membrane lipoprotein-sorting protein
MVLGVLVLALTATACRDDSGALSVDQIVDRVVKAQSEVTSVHQVADVSMDMGLGTETGFGAMGPITTTMETWTAGQKMRMEWGSDSPLMGGTVMVSDGQTVQMYTPTTKQVMEMPVPKLDDAAVSPQQSAAMTREWVTRLLQRADVELLGMEEVAGRQAFKLGAKPKAASGGSDVADLSGDTVWIDSEHFYPLKLDMPMGSMRMAMTVREIEFNATFPPEQFTLDLPADVEKMAIPVPSFPTTTADEAAAKVSFPLLAADPAESAFQLESTHVTDLPGLDDKPNGFVMQAYKGPAGTVMVQQTRAAASSPDLASAMGSAGSSREVQVNGHTATLVTLGLAGSMISWQTDETHVTVTGDLAEADLLAFAESLR